MKIKLKDIKPNPINDDIYSSTDLSDLVQSIKDNGQLEKIVINKNNQIVSGHRRYYAHKQLGLEEIDCDVRDFENDVIALIEFNRSRTKSVQDILNESRILEKEYKKIIGRGKRTDREGKGRMTTLVEVSKSVGVGTTNLKKIKSISNYEPELLKQIDSKELSINQAYQKVRDKHMKSKQSTKGNFGVLFRNLLNKENPPMDEVLKTILTTYPYSLELNKMLSQHKDNIVPMIDDKRDELIDNLEFLKTLPAKQEVVYKKLKEIQRSKFDGYTEGSMFRDLSTLGKTSISGENLKEKPNEVTGIRDCESIYKEVIRDIEEFDFELDFMGGHEEPPSHNPSLHTSPLEEWNIIRTYIHTLEWNPNPGRLLRFKVVDKHHQRVLGVISCGSDFTTLGVRDDFIGWSDLHKYDKHKLNHTSVVSSIVPVQPFGYNLLGGKLLACISTGKGVRDCWKDKYGDTLVGNTTTSLYGDYSMYNSIPLWKKLGHSRGEILIKPDKEIYDYWKDFVKLNYPDYYKEAISKSSPKQNVLNLIFKILGIKPGDYKNEYQRGVYFSSFYENTKEFLTDKIKEKDLVLKDKFKSDEWFLNWWKEKATRRFTKLYKEGRLSKDVLWYKDMKEDEVNSYLMSQGIKIS